MCDVTDTKDMIQDGKKIKNIFLVCKICGEHMQYLEVEEE